jgi:hypothetical protein
LRYATTTGTFCGMNPYSRRAVAVAVAFTLGVVGLGCGFANQANTAVDTALILGDFADRLTRSAEMTYTAEYGVPSGTVTLTQQPPNAAFQSETGRFVITATHMISCTETVCQRAPNQANADTAGLVASAVGAGYVTPDLVRDIVADAALAPKAKVDGTEREIAGEPSICVAVTGLERENGLNDFSVCVTQTGILASFSGNLTNGRQGSIELKSYRMSVDATAFEVPEGATVTDVPALGP